MDYTQFIKAELLVLVPALYGLGLMLEKSETVKNKYIPLILLVVGTVLSCLYIIGTEGVNSTSIFTAIVQGMICPALAVFGDQLYKQSTKGDE